MLENSKKRLAASALTVSLASISLLTPVAQAAKVQLQEDSKIYMTAGQAEENKNSVGVYKAGEYFVYKRFGNAINISKTEKSAGAWVDASKLESTSNSLVAKQETKESSTVEDVVLKFEVEGNKVILNEDVEIYINADDAKNKVNSRGVYNKGEYYIYKQQGNAYNIARFQGAPGGWVYQEEIIKKVEVKEELKEEVKETEAQSNKFTLKNTVSGFRTANNAKSSTNPVNQLAKGEYFIFKKYNGMINVSKSANSAGSWINPGHTSPVKVERRAPQSSNTNTRSQNTNTTATKEVNTAPANSVSGNAVVNGALRYLGSRYVYGGSTPAGFDCSGFTSYVYRNFAGKSIPRSSSAQASVGTPVSINNLQAGDLVFYNTSGRGISHVAIYDGNGGLIHATNPRTGVIRESMNSRYWSSRYVTARRVK